MFIKKVRESFLAVQTHLFLFNGFDIGTEQDVLPHI